ncbi:MAG: fasciclin domain-containing protein [Myxococcales bacterium]|nr:fasciclin domain-containing protein [Myxococcales bacterium]
MFSRRAPAATHRAHRTGLGWYSSAAPTAAATGLGLGWQEDIYGQHEDAGTVSARAHRNRRLSCGQRVTWHVGRAPLDPADPPRRACGTLNQCDSLGTKPCVGPDADHTTLVAALKAADYVTAVANPGPLTVFAPTDAAFGKLPAGTVETLVKPENIDQLKDILKYHVTTSVYTEDKLTDGMELGMANGSKTVIRLKDGKITINGANVLASVRASNGVVHVIDAVLTPPAR